MLQINFILEQVDLPVSSSAAHTPNHIRFEIYLIYQQGKSLVGILVAK